MTVPIQSSPYPRKSQFFLFFLTLLIIAAFKFYAPRDLPSLGAVPAFRATFVTAEGRGVLAREDLLGKPWIADFVFTRCQGPCPMLTANMAQLARSLPEAIRLVSFTVDPENDTLGVLQTYAKRFNANSSRWCFLRGAKGELYQLMKSGFKLSVAQDVQTITHSTKFVLVDARGDIRGYYDGESAIDLKNIQKDALRLLSN